MDKDQTYYLSSISEEQLKRVCMPCVLIVELHPLTLCRLSSHWPTSPNHGLGVWLNILVFLQQSGKRAWVCASSVNGGNSVISFVSSPLEICSSENENADLAAQYTSAPAVQGHLVDAEGKRLAKHDGQWYYTIGQRARVAGMDGRWFVAKKGVGESKHDILVVPGACVNDLLRLVSHCIPRVER
jgi:tRNA U34 2-thiouridine synthase MnmA/TrmU